MPNPDKIQPGTAHVVVRKNLFSTKVQIEAQFGDGTPIVLAEMSRDLSEAHALKVAEAMAGAVRGL